MLLLDLEFALLFELDSATARGQCNCSNNENKRFLHLLLFPLQVKFTFSMAKRVGWSTLGRTLTLNQRELHEKFADASGEEVHPQSKNFFEKVRELFG